LEGEDGPALLRQSAFAEASARQPTLLRHDGAELGSPSRSCEAAKLVPLAGILSQYRYTSSSH